MKKRMLILGNSMFRDVDLKDNNFVIVDRNVISKLLFKYEIENISKKSMTSGVAYVFADVFTKSESFNECVIALGEADIDNLSVQDFETNLERIVSLLMSRSVKPLLVSIPKEYRNDMYENVIERVAIKYSIPYIFEGKKNKKATKSFITDFQLKKALLAIF